MRIKIRQINIDICSNQIAGVNRLFVLFYSNQDDNSKRFKAKNNIYQNQKELLIKEPLILI